MARCLQLKDASEQEATDVLVMPDVSKVEIRDFGDYAPAVAAYPYKDVPDPTLAGASNNYADCRAKPSRWRRVA